MLRKTKQNNRFKWAVIVSTALHILLFVALSLNLLNTYINVSYNNKLATNVVMVDPGIIIQKYNDQQQQMKKIYRKNQVIEQNCSEQIKKEHLHIQESMHEQTQQQKQMKIKEISTNTKVKEEVIGARKISQEEKKKTVSNGVNKVNSIKKGSGIKKVSITNVNDIFNDLSLNKNILKINNNNTKDNDITSSKNSNVKSNYELNDDINSYAKKIRLAIESCFYDSTSYSGKICTLRIKLSPNGTLLDIQSEGGDPILCNAALAAAHQAKIPKPPSQAVYEVFKTTLLDFKP